MILLLNKEGGMTSHSAMARAKRLVGIKKMGHTGTLDPMATGLLPLLCDRTTKLADIVVGTDKGYVAGVRFGIETSTQDVTGEIINSCDMSVTIEELRAVCQNFVGEIEQIPPMYSAIKKDGVRLYELARRGETIEREARKITIYSIDVLECEGDFAKIDVRCSKGTYIRTLIHDIGLALGGFASMESLERTSVGDFHIKNAVTLSQIENAVKNGEKDSLFIKEESLFEGLAKFEPSDFHYKLLCDGQKVLCNKMKIEAKHDEFIRLYHQSEFAGLLKCEVSDEGERLFMYWRRQL